jgi:alkylhydroperoxidase family enzyme
MTHVSQSDLALYAAGDLLLWRRIRVRLHVSACRDCSDVAEAHRADRGRLRQSADAMPEGLDWNRLSAEMTANIHLGLEAGECVTPRDRRTPIFKPHEGWAARFFESLSWKPAAVVAGVTMLLAGSWWLNVPAADSQSLMRAFRAIASGGRDRLPQGVRLIDDRMPIVEVTASGISIRENGSALGVSAGPRPVAVSVSVQGSANAHYVDADTGQVTITSVYVQ